MKKVQFLPHLKVGVSLHKCHDLGIPEAEDEGDDFIERLTY